MLSQTFMFLAVGLSALLVAIVLALVLLRAVRTLTILEETLLTAEVAMQEVVPEVRVSLGNLNDITSGVNAALQVAGTGAGRLGSELGEAAERGTIGATAFWSGVRVGSRSLWRSYFGGGGSSDA